MEAITVYKANDHIIFYIYSRVTPIFGKVFPIKGKTLSVTQTMKR